MSAEKLLLGGLLAAAALGIGGAIWFNLTHDCVRSHEGTCYQTTCFEVSKGVQNCSTTSYTCTVCDEWQRKK